MLEIVGVSKKFVTKDETLQALLDVNLGIRDGEFISFVGPSGCGKTTLLKIIDGLIPADEGRILLHGEQLQGVSNDLAFVFQDIDLLPWRNVVQNVELGLETRGLSRSERRARALATLGRVGLESSALKPPYMLSGGMQQRVGVARALAVEPKVLLMDEPFGQLDNFTRETLQVEISRLWREAGNMTVVFVTHDVDEAIFLSDRIALFGTNPGRILEVLEVDIPHPRAEGDVNALPQAIKLRQHIVRRLDTKAQVFV